MVGTLDPGVGGDGRNDGCGSSNDVLHFDRCIRDVFESYRCVAREKISLNTTCV